MNEFAHLPKLTDEERKAIDSVDMTPVLGTLEEQLTVATNAAIRYMRERDEAREAALWLYELSCYNPARDFATQKWPWLEQELAKLNR